MANNLRISSAGNTQAPALAVLNAMGFVVAKCRTEAPLLVATSEEFEVVAEDPIQLLGLATLLKSRGSNWGPTDGEINELLCLELDGCV